MKLIIDIPGCHKPGVIYLTDLPGRKEMYAHCPCREEHGAKCIKTKTCLEGRKKAQGRPIGFLTAWLMGACSERLKESTHAKYVPTLEQRRAARRLVHLVPGAKAFFDRERPARAEAGEDSEPELCP